MSAAKASAATLVDPNEVASPLDAAASWGVVIVYDDAPAGKHAIHTLEGVRRQLGGRIALHPSLWRFDLLEDADWRAAATAEAVQAGLVIISTSSKGDLPAAVRDWVHGCLQAGTSSPSALVALLGPAGAMDTSDSARILFLRNAAEAAGFGFFAPTPQTANPEVAGAPSRKPARLAHRILLVEDDCTILQFSVLVLVRASYDLLITDNQMPGLSGLELVSELRSEQLELPVVVASGGIGAEELAQNQRLQPAIALPKPFSADQLLETVAEALHRASRDPAHTQVSFPAYGDSYSHWGLNE
jgi:CheY-like chemotaxis protein